VYLRWLGHLCNVLGLIPEQLVANIACMLVPILCCFVSSRLTWTSLENRSFCAA
jgi:hypothetical protein